MKKNNVKIIAVVLLLLGTFAVYSPVLKHGFLNWDDDTHLYENSFVRGGLGAENLGDIFTSYVNDVYIPLTTLSFAIEYRFFGLDPFVYHLNNLILHLLVVLLVFVIGGRLGLPWPAAWLAALIFAVHPMHVESVAWVTERKDVLYSFFYLLAVYFYLRHMEHLEMLSRNQRPSRRFLFGVEVFAILSLLTKPMALSLPLVLLLMDWFKGRGVTRRAFMEKIPLFILTVLIAWATYAVQARVPGESLLRGALVWIWTLTFYFKQFIFPLVSVPIYRLPKPVSFANIEYIFALVILLILIFIFIKFRKNRWLIFGLAYFFLSAFFLFRFDDKADINVVADRFMYLPSLGICLWLGAVIERFWSQARGHWRAAALILIAGIFIITGIKTYGQMFIWRDNFTLWEHQLRYSPEDPVALNNLGVSLRDTASYKEIEDEFRRQALESPEEARSLLAHDPRFEPIRRVSDLYSRAIASDARYADALYNMGNLFKDLGFLDEALMYYVQTVARDKNYREAYFNIGRIHMQRDEPAKAIAGFNALLDIETKPEAAFENVIMAYNKVLSEKGPNTSYEEARAATIQRYQEFLKTTGDAKSYFRMGFVYHDMKDYERAAASYRLALEKDPDDPDILYNLGNVYIETGRPQEALEFYRKAVTFKSRYIRAYLNMGIALNQLNRQKEAEAAFLKAVELDPRSTDAFFNLGYIYEASGQMQKALEAYQNTVNIDSRHAEAYYNMGNVYVALGRLQQAIESYKKAIAAKPDHEDAQANLTVVSGMLK